MSEKEKKTSLNKRAFLHKKTSLGEGASIYQKRDESESEKSKWRRMNRAQKWVHFKTYYLRLTILGCCVLALVGFFIYQDVFHKTNVVYQCALVNEKATEIPISMFAEGFMRSMDMDPSQNKASFYLYYTNQDLAKEVGAVVSSDLTRLSSMIYASKLDAMIAGQEDFDGYMGNGCFTDLAEFLTEEERKEFEDRLYIPDVPENTEKHPYGVYLDQSSVYQQIFEGGGGIVEKPILGIIFNSENKEMSRKFLHYLLSAAGEEEGNEGGNDELNKGVTSND